MAKMFEDAFRSLGILKEDTPEYVAETILEVVVLPRQKISKAARGQGEKADAKDKDWVEVIISPYIKNYATRNTDSTEA
jgi:hypothetical protein